MWLPREPKLGVGVRHRMSLYPRVSHYSGLQVPSRPVFVSSPGVPAPRWWSPRPEPPRETPVSGVGSGRAGKRGGRPGLRLELSRAAQPSPAPLCSSPQGGPSTAWLGWTPRLRLGEYIEDGSSVSPCVCGLAVESAECAAPLRRATSVARFSAQVFLLFSQSFLRLMLRNSLRLPWSRDSQKSIFFFFSFEGWIDSHFSL